MKENWPEAEITIYHRAQNKGMQGSEDPQLGQQQEHLPDEKIIIRTCDYCKAF